MRFRIGLAGLALLAASGALGAERCSSINLASIGTGEVTAATEVTAFIFEALGFDARIEVGTPEEMYRRLAAGELDVIMGVSADAVAAEYRASGQIERNGQTDVRPGYASECVSNATLMRRLSFPAGMESEIMALALRDGEAPRKAVKVWMRANRAVWRN